VRFDASACKGQKREERLPNNRFQLHICPLLYLFTMSAFNKGLSSAYVVTRQWGLLCCLPEVASPTIKKHAGKRLLPATVYNAGAPDGVRHLKHAGKRLMPATVYNACAPDGVRHLKHAGKRLLPATVYNAGAPDGVRHLKACWQKTYACDCLQCRCSGRCQTPKACWQKTFA